MNQEAADEFRVEIAELIAKINWNLDYVTELEQQELIGYRDALYDARNLPSQGMTHITVITPISNQINAIVDYKFQFRGLIWQKYMKLISFLVERDGTNYQTEGSNLSELLDDDLMLVERGGTCYKATGEEIKESLAVGVYPPLLVYLTNQVSLVLKRLIL